MSNLVPQPLSIDFVRDLIKIVDALRTEVFEKDVDFGVIPGTGDKPTLLLPGMEKLMRVLNVTPDYIDRRVIVDYDKMLFHYEFECILVNVDTGQIIPGGRGLGLCTSMESTFQWRQGGRKCPVCGKEALIRGKDEYGGGWVCFKKRDGCGAKFKVDDPDITSQSAGRVRNPDLPDQINAIMKRAKKRALGDAVKGAACISKFFTVDLEDNVRTDTHYESDVVEAEIVEDAPHWSIDDTTLDKKVQESYGMNRQAMQEVLNKTYDEFATRADAAAAIKVAMGKVDKPATPKSALTEVKKPDETPEWYKKGFTKLTSFTRNWWGRTPAECVKDANWKTYNSLEDAMARVRQAAAMELWDIQVDKATYKAEKSQIIFSTPLGEFITYSRQTFVKLLDGGEMGRDAWAEVLDWSEGEHRLPEPCWLLLKRDDNKIALDTIKSAAIPF